jgi:hypothetical protein
MAAPQLCDEAGDFAIRVIAWGTAAAAAAYVAVRLAIANRIHGPIFARGGKTGVGHDYVRDEARQLAKALNISYCEALQAIYEAARKAGDFKKANDTKATQKEDGCRGH